MYGLQLVRLSIPFTQVRVESFIELTWTPDDGYRTTSVPTSSDKLLEESHLWAARVKQAKGWQHISERLPGVSNENVVSPMLGGQIQCLHSGEWMVELHPFVVVYSWTLSVVFNGEMAHIREFSGELTKHLNYT